MRSEDAAGFAAGFAAGVAGGVAGVAGFLPLQVPAEEGEIVITKHRVSAFTGTDLAMILRANDIDTLVLYGIATSGVVLSTLLEAADADFRLAVIKAAAPTSTPISMIA